MSVSQFGNVKIKNGSWKTYDQFNHAADEVCKYLRIRRHVDGVFLHMNKPFEYKSREFKRLLKLMASCNAGNYFGVAFNRHGILGDTIFTDFWHEYKLHPHEYWLNNYKPLRKLIDKYKNIYRRRGGMQEGGENSDEYYRNKYIIHNIDAHKEWKRVFDEDGDFDPDGHVKDYYFKARKESYYKYFNWPRDSKRAARRSERNKLEHSRAKSWQSLRAFDALTNANNIMLNSRFVLTCNVSRKAHSGKADLFLIDTALNREHLFIHAYANTLTDDSSIWTHTQNLADKFSHYTQVDFKNKTIAVPEFRDNPRGDIFNYEKVLDLAGGGYIEHGWPHGDSIAAELMAGEFVWTTKSVKSVGSGCAEKGAKILTMVMRYFEATYQSNIWKKEDKDD